MTMLSALLEYYGQEPGERLYGVYPAVVRGVEDPENKGRIRVACAAISSSYLSDWISVIQADAGSGYGAYLIPELEDQVIIAFLNGSPRTPIVLGSIYSANKLPLMARSATSVPRYFATPAGHQIVMEDKTGKRIEIVDATGSNKVLIDTAANKITISASADIEISAGGNLTLSANGTVTVSGASINLN